MDMLERFHQDGYYILEDFISKTHCERLKERANFLIDKYSENAEHVAFSTKDQSHLKHKYFLDSANNISLFFEEKALDDQGKLGWPIHQSVNKIGHSLHKEDDCFRQLCNSPEIHSFATQLNIDDPQILQTMYIFKQPKIGGEVSCHQDATFLYIKEKPVIGLWLALEDASIENGCLWAIPGGHQNGLKERMRLDQNNEIYYEYYDKTPWDQSKLIPLAVKQGSVILLDGLLPHMSKENYSSKSRHAFTMHMMPKKHHFAKDNWLKPG